MKIYTAYLADGSTIQFPTNKGGAYLRSQARQLADDLGMMASIVKVSCEPVQKQPRSKRKTQHVKQRAAKMAS